MNILIAIIALLAFFGVIALFVIYFTNANIFNQRGPKVDAIIGGTNDSNIYTNGWDIYFVNPSLQIDSPVATIKLNKATNSSNIANRFFYISIPPDFDRTLRLESGNITVNPTLDFNNTTGRTILLTFYFTTETNAVFLGTYP